MHNIKFKPTLITLTITALMLGTLASPATAQPINTFPNIQALLANDGSFLNPPITLPERSHIGLTIPQALAELGTPQAIYTIRGAEPWQDDVIFFYPTHTYLYWYQNRVWQIRYDHRHTEPVAGLRMGQTMPQVLATLGQPHYIAPNTLFYNLHTHAYPIRLRLSFNNDRLHDLYLYRSDF